LVQVFGPVLLSRLVGDRGHQPLANLDARIAGRQMNGNPGIPRPRVSIRQFRLDVAIKQLEGLGAARVLQIGSQEPLS
jgi:hypothetical protein